MEKIIAPVDATPSLEGYEYQVHIAINVVLKKILELIGTSNVFDGWMLQIEGEEDFSLLKNDKYVTLHQVKLGRVDLSPEDKFAFVIGILQERAERGFFHVNPTHRITKDFLCKTKSHIDELKNNLSKSVCSRDELEKGDSEDDFIILEKIKVQTPKASLYNILNYICAGNKDKMYVQGKVSELDTDCDDYVKEIEKRKTAFLLEHPDKKEDESIVSEWSEKFSGSKEAIDKSVGVILKIMKSNFPDRDYIDKTYCKFVYDLLIAMIKRAITEHYVNKTKSGKCLVSFSQIYDEISRDYPNEIESREYKYYFLRRTIEDQFEKFVSDECKEAQCEKCMTRNTCNLYEQGVVFSERNPEEKREILFHLLLEQPDKFNNLPGDELIKCQLLKLIREISSLSITDKNAIVSSSSYGKFYWLSLDESRERDRLRKKIQEGIKASDDKAFLYECDVLITDRLNEQFFIVDGANVNILEDSQIREMNAITGIDIHQEIANVNKPKVIRLIDSNCAKGELEK